MDHRHKKGARSRAPYKHQRLSWTSTLVFIQPPSILTIIPYLDRERCSRREGKFRFADVDSRRIGALRKLEHVARIHGQSAVRSAREHVLRVGPGSARPAADDGASA